MVEVTEARSTLKIRTYQPVRLHLRKIAVLPREALANERSNFATAKRRRDYPTRQPNVHTLFINQPVESSRGEEVDKLRRIVLRRILVRLRVRIRRPLARTLEVMLDVKHVEFANAVRRQVGDTVERNATLAHLAVHTSGCVLAAGSAATRLLPDHTVL